MFTPSPPGPSKTTLGHPLSDPKDGNLDTTRTIQNDDESKTGFLGVVLDGWKRTPRVLLRRDEGWFVLFQIL